MNDSFKPLKVNQDNKHFENSFELFAQFIAYVFSSFWYLLFDNISVSYVLKGVKNYDQSGITG